ncbi:MAG: hypothetical protein ICV84_18820 [Flavisolibacter sp.]|nr:hypothetical protein [Flavisolibacter sp.]
MRYLVSERKLGLAILSFALGIFLATKASLFASPVLVSEKGLLFIILAIGLIVSSVFIAVRSIRKA